MITRWTTEWQIRKQKWEGKSFYGCFKRLINNISHDKTWTWLRKGHFRRETEPLLLAAQNNAIRTNHIKARIYRTLQNNKLWHGILYIYIYIWTLTKRLEKKLDGKYTRMLRAIMNKSWQQHPTRHQLYGHLPPITKTIQVRRTRHVGHCWRSRDELIRDVLLWIPTHGRAKAGRPARTYIQQLCEDTGCCPEDLPRAMNDREEWRERVRDIRAASTIWWWWYIYIYIYIERERVKVRSIPLPIFIRINRH